MSVNKLHISLSLTLGLLALAGILALLGGIYALRRRLWGLALAGSLATILFLPVFGIPAIILTSHSEREFL